MLVPVLGGRNHFRRREALRDALAALTLASMNISQVLDLHPSQIRDQ
jgi:hypothetical protein